MDVHAIILDLDDTIVDENPGREVARRRAVERIVGRHPRLEAAVVGRMQDEVSRWYWSDGERHRVGRLNMPAARRLIVGRVLAALGVADAGFADEIVEEYQRVRDEALVCFPGAREAVAALRGHFGRMGLLTNGAGPPQREKLERFGLAGLFNAIQVEGEVGVGKPEVVAFAGMLERLGVSAAEAVMVGNDYAMDIVPARALGMKVVWISEKADEEAMVAGSLVEAVGRLVMVAGD